MGLVVRAPGLEPRTSVEGPFSLLKDLSQRCLDDINKGRTATSAQLLLMLAGAGEWAAFLISRLESIDWIN